MTPARTHLNPRIPLQLEPMSSPSKVSSKILFILLRPRPERVRQSTSYHIHQTQPHRRTTDDPSCAELVDESQPPPTGKQEICSTERCGRSSAVNLKVLEVQVCAEEEQRRKDHGKWLEWSGMLGEDECGQEGARYRVL
jgi:hypothetical protein